MDLEDEEEHQEFIARLTDEHIHHNSHNMTVVELTQQLWLVHLNTLAPPKYKLIYIIQRANFNKSCLSRDEM